MRFATTILLSFGLLVPAAAQGQAGQSDPPAPVSGDLRAVSPALARHTEQTLLGEVWKRSDLAPRDRSIVTLSILIARGQTAELPLYLDRALDAGVKPAEISEMLTHLAFYAGCRARM